MLLAVGGCQLPYHRGEQWNGGSLARITAPTLVLHGQQDPLLRVTAARDIAGGPRRPPAHLPGVGHFLGADVWATYAHELRALADRADGQSPTVAPTHG